MSHLRSLGLVLPWLAGAWVFFNAAYVYLAGHLDRSYRLESAAWVLVFVLLWFVRRRVTGVTRSPMTDRALVVGLGAVVVSWLVVMAPLVSQPFLSDDYVFLEWAHRSGDVFHEPAYFRPLYATLFLVVSRLSASPVLFHLVSLVLHLTSALLVYGLSKQFFGERAPALLVFAVVLLNPIQLEAVAWISGLQELLWSTIVLTAVWVYTRPRAALSPVRIAGTLLLALLGMLAKETGVCVVLLFALADVLLDRWRRPATWGLYGLFGVVLAGYLALRGHYKEFEPNYWFWPSRYFVKQFLGRPYEVFAQPWNTAAVDVPGVVRWLVAASLTLTLLATVAWRRVGWRIFVGPAIIVASTLPLYAYFFVMTDLISSRYVYFAAIGWAFLLAELGSRLATRTSVYLAATAVVAAMSATSLQVNTRPWRASGELVTAMAARVKAGGGVNEALAGWRLTHSGNLQMKDGVPYQYRRRRNLHQRLSRVSRFHARLDTAAK